MGIAVGLRARKIIGRLGLVPRSLRGRAFVKCLLHRDMIRVPPEISETFATSVVLTELDAGPVRTFRVIYLTA